MSPTAGFAFTPYRRLVDTEFFVLVKKIDFYTYFAIINKNVQTQPKTWRSIMATLQVTSLSKIADEAVKLYWQTKDHCHTQPSIAGCIDQAKKVFRIFEGDLSQMDEVQLENLVRHKIGQGRSSAKNGGGWWYHQDQSFRTSA